MPADDNMADFELALSQATGGSLPGPFAYAIAAGQYSHKPETDQAGLGKLIFEMRNGSPDATGLIARVIEHFLDNHPLPAQPDLIIPIPDSVPDRVFHPVHFLAERLSERFSCRLAGNVITRSVNEKPQRERSFEDRLSDRRLLYKIENPQMVAGKQVLIFDDIFATGRSVTDAARVISECHPSKIMVLVVARLVEAGTLLP